MKLKRKYEHPSQKVIVLKHQAPLLVVSGVGLDSLDDFGEGGDPLSQG